MVTLSTSYGHKRFKILIEWSRFGALTLRPPVQQQPPQQQHALPPSQPSPSTTDTPLQFPRFDPESFKLQLIATPRPQDPSIKMDFVDPSR